MCFETVFFFSGETSGDRIAAQIMQQWKTKNPQLQFIGVGGTHSLQAGLHLIDTISSFQIMGFSQVIQQLPHLLSKFFRIKNQILEHNPKAVVFVDSPDFSLRMAKSLRKSGYKGKIIQVVAPTVWAWRSNRRNDIFRHFDLLLTLFAFELPYFTHPTFPTVWMGHPMCQQIGYPASDLIKIPLLALFPGSRPEEIRRNLPIQLQGAALFAQQHPGMNLAISVAETSYQALIEEILAAHRIQAAQSPSITLFSFEERFAIMRAASLAIAKSGTVTLELALFEVPTVVTYKVSLLNRFLAKYVYTITTPYFALCNILKKKELFPELITQPPTAEDICTALSRNMHSAPHIREECRSLHRDLYAGKPPPEIAVDAIRSCVHET